jgi:hypothetical protein
MIVNNLGIQDLYCSGKLDFLEPSSYTGQGRQSTGTIPDFMHDTSVSYERMLRWVQTKFTENGMNVRREWNKDEKGDFGLSSIGSLWNNPNVRENCTISD